MAMIRPAQLAAVAVPLPGCLGLAVAPSAIDSRGSRFAMRHRFFPTRRRRSATSHTPDGNAALPGRMNAESSSTSPDGPIERLARFDKDPRPRAWRCSRFLRLEPCRHPESSQGGPGSLGRPRQALSGPQPTTCANNNAPLMMATRPRAAFTTFFTTRSRLASARGKPSRLLSWAADPQLRVLCCVLRGRRSLDLPRSLPQLVASVLECGGRQHSLCTA